MNYADSELDKSSKSYNVAENGNAKLEKQWEIEHSNLKRTALAQ